MFGMRVHPVKGGRLFHQGVDLAAPCGTPVYSAGNGKITEARYSGVTDGSCMSGMQKDIRHCTRI